MDRLDKILLFAIKKHFGQTDKAGEPYIHHPLYLALQLETESEKVVAILHDILEDTDTQLTELMEIGVTDDELEAIKILTHDKKTTYMDYIKEIPKNELAKKVKIKDLKHNLSDRGIKISKSLTERYIKALNYLEQ